MKDIALLLITGILMAADQGKTSQSSREAGQFDYTTQIGIVFRSEDEQLRLEIKNPNLAENDEIVVVIPNDTQKVARAVIDEKVKGNCSQGGIYDGGASVIDYGQSLARMTILPSLSGLQRRPPLLPFVEAVSAQT